MMRNSHLSCLSGVKPATITRRIGLTLCTLGLVILPFSLQAEEAPSAERPAIRNVIKPAPGLDPAEEVGPIVLSNMPASQAFALLQEYSGRVVLVGSGVSDPKLNFNSAGKMRRDEALFALENLFLLNGIALIDVDGKFLRATPANQSGRNAPPLLNARAEGQENAEQVFSRIFHLRNIDSGTATRYIGPLVSPGGVGSVINMNASDSIMVIDRLSNLQFFESLMETIDRPLASRNEIYFFRLDNMSAWDVRNTMHHLRNQTHSAQLRNSLFWVDSRTNQLIVSTPPENREFVEGIIAELDKEVAPMTTSKVFQVRNSNLWTVHRILQGIITNQQRIFSRMGFRSTEQYDRDRRNEEGEPYIITTDGSEAPEGEPSRAGETVQQMLEGVQENGVEPMMASGMPELQFSPYISLFPDPQNSSIIVYGTKADIQRVEYLLNEIDQRTAPVTESDVFYLEHAEAATIANLISRTISVQRASFSREGLRSGQERTFTGSDASAIQQDMMDDSVQFSPFASVIADRRTNALLIYGTREDIRRVQTLVAQIDVEVSPLTRSEVFYLEQGNASTTANILTRIVQGQQRAMRDILSQQRQIRGNTQEDEMSPVVVGGDQVMQFSPYVNIVPNPRNNSIVIYGTNADIRQLGELVQMNDVKIAPRTSSRTFFIKHAQASAVQRVINPLIQAQLRVRERESTLRRVFLRNGEGGDDAGGASLPTGGGEGGEMASGMDGLGDALGAGEDFDDDVQFSPYVSLAADERSNSIIAYGTPFDLEQIEDLINQIDRVLPQVRIEVVIAEVSLSSNASSGLGEFGIQYRNPFDPSNPGIGNIGVQTTGRNAGEGREPFFEGSLTLDDFSLQTVFRVAREKNNVKVLSAPTITTTHNRLATINVGESRPVITSSTSSFSSNNNLTTRSEVEYRDIGIELRVRPLISDGNVIQMELEQVVETVVDTQTIDGNVQPIIGTRRATSFVSIRNQEVLVMGGLQSVDSSDRDGRVWLLGDLPLIGGVFRPNDRQQTVRELIIFIRPLIVESGDEASILSAQALEKTAIGEDVSHYLREGNFREQGLMVPPSASDIPLDGRLETAVEEREREERESEREAQRAEREAGRQQSERGESGTTDSEAATPAAPRSQGVTQPAAPTPPAEQTPANEVESTEEDTEFRQRSFSPRGRR